MSDLTPGNVLFRTGEDGYEFALVDINRMTFGIVGVYDAGYGCAFAHFFFRENMFLKRRRLMSLCWWAL